MVYNFCFRQFILISRNSGNKLSCLDYRLPWNSKTTSSHVEGVKQGDSQVEDVGIIIDDPNPNVIDVDPNPDIVDDAQPCLGTESLNTFHCNIYKNVVTKITR